MPDHAPPPPAPSSTPRGASLEAPRPAPRPAPEGPPGGLVGLIPAAGSASRLGRLPCSKEVLPLGPDASGRARVAADPLLEGLRLAGADFAVVALRRGKWDVPAYLGGGREAGVPLAYVVVDATPGVPWTLDAAWPLVRGRRVALGFPDIAFEPADALARVAARLDEGDADLALGAFPAADPARSDMLAFGRDARGRDTDEVAGIEIKPARTALRWSWALAAWTPAFGERLHDWCARARREDGSGGGSAEAFLGDAFRDLIGAGARARAVRFPDGSFADLGTPAGWTRALRGAGA